MKVHDLIALLQTMQQDAEVKFSVWVDDVTQSAESITDVVKSDRNSNPYYEDAVVIK